MVLFIKTNTPKMTKTNTYMSAHLTFIQIVPIFTHHISNHITFCLIIARIFTLQKLIRLGF